MIDQQKAEPLYAAIDGSLFYSRAGSAEASPGDVTFRLPTAALEARFVAEAQDCGFLTLKAQGGVRVTLDDPVRPEAIETLVQFMKEFSGIGWLKSADVIVL